MSRNPLPVPPFSSPRVYTVYVMCLIYICCTYFSCRSDSLVKGLEAQYAHEIRRLENERVGMHEAYSLFMAGNDDGVKITYRVTGEDQPADFDHPTDDWKAMEVKPGPDPSYERFKYPAKPLMLQSGSLEYSASESAVVQRKSDTVRTKEGDKDCTTILCNPS